MAAFVSSLFGVESHVNYQVALPDISCMRKINITLNRYMYIWQRWPISDLIQYFDHHFLNVQQNVVLKKTKHLLGLLLTVYRKNEIYWVDQSNR